MEPPITLDTGSDRFRHVAFAGRTVVPRANVGIPPAQAIRLTLPEADDDDAGIRFLRGVLLRSGVDGKAYRPGPLRRRRDACLRRLRARDEEEAATRIEQAPELIEQGARALLIGVTEFFRDPPLFPTLAALVVPAIGAGHAAPRVWSVGCSEGCELYSTAILLAEAGRLRGARLLGTDCRRDAVRAARLGTYAPDLVRRLPERLQDLYLRRRGEMLELDPRLREAAEFRVADALRPPEESGWDLILCRNLAMYLTEPVARELWDRLTASLMPGGFLVTGRAERPPRGGLTPIAPSIFRKIPEE